MPEVNPPGTRRLDVTCDHVTVALRAMRELHGVLNATVFGQSMHLLVDEELRRDEIEEKMRSVGITQSGYSRNGSVARGCFRCADGETRGRESTEQRELVTTDEPMNRTRRNRAVNRAAMRSSLQSLI